MTLQQATQELTSNDWYTPRWIIDLARRTMGGIDIDPCSCAIAQTVVQAGRWIGLPEDGRLYPWEGRLWLNPPYDNPLPWVNRMFSDIHDDVCAQAMLLVNLANSPKWTRRLWHGDGLVCLLDERIKFWRPGRPDKCGDRDQMIWYIGDNRERFTHLFQPYGAIR